MQCLSQLRPPPNWKHTYCNYPYSVNISTTVKWQSRCRWPRGLRPFSCWDRRFESRCGHGCLSVVFVVNVTTIVLRIVFTIIIIIIRITIIIIIYLSCSWASCVSRSLFKGLPFFHLPVGQYCFITLGNLFRGILFTCCIQLLFYSSSLSKIGVIFNSFAICAFVLWSVQVHLAVFLMYFISAAVILLASLALTVQVSLPHSKTGRASVLYSFILVFLRVFCGRITIHNVYIYLYCGNCSLLSYYAARQPRRAQCLSTWWRKPTVSPICTSTQVQNCGFISRHRNRTTNPQSTHSKLRTRDIRKMAAGCAMHVASLCLMTCLSSCRTSVRNTLRSDKHLAMGVTSLV